MTAAFENPKLQEPLNWRLEKLILYSTLDYR